MESTDNIVTSLPFLFHPPSPDEDQSSWEEDEDSQSEKLNCKTAENNADIISKLSHNEDKTRIPHRGMIAGKMDEEIISNDQSENEIPLTEEIVESFCVSRIFRVNKGRVNYMDYSSQGDCMITSAYDDQINLYNCLTGTHTRTYFSKRYGVDLIKFTHSKTTVLYASTKVNHDLRYLSLHDNKFIRFFSGHTDKVTCIGKSPIDDLFATASLDNSIRIWDSGTPDCTGIINLTKPGLVFFDQEGFIFGVGMKNDTIKLYDLRKYEKGPFSTFLLPPDPQKLEWTSINFSPDGSQLMINTDGRYLRFVDGYNGNLIREIDCRSISKGYKFEASYTPDGKFVFAAGAGGYVSLIRVQDGKVQSVLQSNNSSTVGCLKFNPKLMLLATAAEETAFWIPNNLPIPS